MDNIDPRYGFIPILDASGVAGDGVIDVNSLFDNSFDNSLLPYDLNGNVRVLRVYWKSRRKIKKVKSYDPMTGEEQFDFYRSLINFSNMAALIKGVGNAAGALSTKILALPNKTL